MALKVQVKLSWVPMLCKVGSSRILENIGILLQQFYKLFSFPVS
jgi:hypothetical protein